VAGIHRRRTKFGQQYLVSSQRAEGSRFAEEHGFDEERCVGSHDRSGSPPSTQPSGARGRRRSSASVRTAGGRSVLPSSWIIVAFWIVAIVSRVISVDKKSRPTQPHPARHHRAPRRCPRMQPPCAIGGDGAGRQWSSSPRQRRHQIVAHGDRAQRCPLLGVKRTSDFPSTILRLMRRERLRRR